VTKEYNVGNLMLLGIGEVFLSAGLAKMTGKERRKLAKQCGVNDDELDAYILGQFTAIGVEALAPSEELTDHTDDDDK